MNKILILFIIPIVLFGNNLENPDISFILNTGFGAYFDNDNGFSEKNAITQGGHAIDENGFGLQGVEFAAGGNVDPYFRYDMNVSLNHMHIEEVYLTSLALPYNFKLRTGYFNAAFGRQNPQHLHIWNFINPPLAHSLFMAEEHLRSTGFEINYLIPFDFYSNLTFQIYDTKQKSNFVSKTFASNIEIDGVEDFLYVVRNENSFDFSKNTTWLFGLSGAFGQSPYVTDNRTTIFGFDSLIKWRPVSTGEDSIGFDFIVEAMLRNTQVSDDLMKDVAGYSELDVKLSRRWITSLRVDYIKLLDGEITENLANNFVEEEKRGSIALTFLPTHFSKFRMQTDIGKADGKEMYYAFFFQFEMNVGAHGAHKF